MNGLEQVNLTVRGLKARVHHVTYNHQGNGAITVEVEATIDNFVPTPAFRSTGKLTPVAKKARRIRQKKGAN